MKTALQHKKMAFCIACAGAVAIASCLSAASEVCAQDLDAAVRALFAERHFDPKIMPFDRRGVDVARLDPLVVQSEWGSISDALSELYARHLGISPSPMISLELAAVRGPAGTLRFRAMLFAADGRVREALARHLACPPDAFTEGKLLAEQGLVRVDRLRAKYKAEGSLVLDSIAGDLLDMLQAGRGPLAQYHLTARNRVATDRVEILTGWKYLDQGAPLKRYFWRGVIRLVRGGSRADVWELDCTVDLGAQLPSQSEPKKIGNTEDEHVEMDLQTNSGSRLRTVRRAVDTNDDVRPADDISPLGALRRALMDQCLAVLFGP